MLSQAANRYVSEPDRSGSDPVELESRLTDRIIRRLRVIHEQVSQAQNQASSARARIFCQGEEDPKAQVRTVPSGAAGEIDQRLEDLSNDVCELTRTVTALCSDI